MEFSFLLFLTLLLIICAFPLLVNSLIPNPNPKQFNPPPSPPAIPILGHLHLIRQPIHRTLQSLSAKYGKILSLRLGSRRVLLVSTPAAVEECFTRHDLAFAGRPQLLAGKYFHYDFTTVFVAPYGDHWRNLRRILNNALFSTASLARFAAVREAETRSLVERIARWGSIWGYRGNVVELKSQIREATFNTMTMAVLGKRYYGGGRGDGDDASDSEANEFKQVMRDIVYLCGKNLIDFLPILQRVDLFRTEKRMAALREKMDKFLQGLVDENRRKLGEEKEEEAVIIEDLLNLQREEPEFLTDQILKGIILVILIGGTDTVATAIEWAMALLLNHPEVMTKLGAEIASKVGQERLVSELDLSNLAYLNHVIDETLRLYPPAPLLGVHQASEDCSVGGYDVRKGTILMVNAWAIHRDPEAWENPTEFVPERFEGGEGCCKSFPFGLGRRGCPGVAVANRVMGLVLGCLVQGFEWERIGMGAVDMTEGLGLTLPRVEPLNVMCKPRDLAMSLLVEPLDL
ncbi:unnamed protein product [Linum tenue]|uniref:Uncharacterized protein n=2 Tax=Linum tenue TaxID=586396 RepID=A0AAV0MZF4_9ROSI|nr:unnamed protein product [Linum tenue]